MKNEVLRIEYRQQYKAPYFPSVYLNVFDGETVGILFDDMQDYLSFLSIFSDKSLLANYFLEINETKVTAENFNHYVSLNTVIIDPQYLLNNNMSLAENVLLSSVNTKSIFVQSGKYLKVLEELFRRFDIDIPVNRPTSEMTFFNRIRICVLRAFVEKKKIIILSEVENYLSEKEVDQLMRLTAAMQKYGFTFLFLGLTGQEASVCCDRQVIVRERRMTPFREEIKRNSLAPRPTSPFAAEPCGNNRPVLTFKEVETDILTPTSFSLRPGELLVVHAEEQCMKELLALLGGKKQPTNGAVLHDQARRKRTSLFQIRGCHSLCYIQEDPIRTMLVPSMTLMDNLCLSVSLKTASPLLSRGERQSVMNMLEGIFDKESYAVPVRDLSLAEQYKAVYCRWLLFRPSVLICIHPYAGVDERIRMEINSMLKLLTGCGIAVMMTVSNSSHMPRESIVRLHRKKSVGHSAR